MKRTLFIGLSGLMMAVPSICSGMSFMGQCATESTTCSYYTEHTGGKTNCSSYGSVVYVGCKRVYSCNSCKTNYTIVSKTISLGDCQVTYNACEYSGQSMNCTLFPNDCFEQNSDWYDAGTGYLARNIYKLNLLSCTCEQLADYICDSANDYYGTASCSWSNGTRTCSGCTYCKGADTWATTQTGYQGLSSKYWSNYSDSCVDDPKYRCDAGYYGTATCSWLNGTRTCSGCSACPAGYYKSYGGDGARGDVCTRCPSSGGVYGTTTAGATAVTQCYIPAGDISWTDSTGTYTCGEDSYYTN